MNFTRRMIGLREETNKTQTQLAHEIGATQRKISYWETGKTEPCIADLISLAEYYKTSIDYLLGLTDVRQPYPPPEQKG